MHGETVKNICSFFMGCHYYDFVTAYKWLLCRFTLQQYVGFYVGPVLRQKRDRMNEWMDGWMLVRKDEINWNNI
jgi:hypothetical protein